MTSFPIEDRIFEKARKGGGKRNVAIDIALLQKQVQNNCDVSDANYGGLFSLCGLLLRLRDMYKWEMRLHPWQEPDPAHLMEWVDRREERWESIAHDEFQPLTIEGETFDPFDLSAINERLRPLGMVYGAGYAALMKPSFFLAKIVSSRKVGQIRIDIVDHELARDLFMTPAMRQGDQIFGRRSAMLFALWDQILEMRPSIKTALSFAFAQYDLDVTKIRSFPHDLGPELERVACAELEHWLYHELGEIREDAFPGDSWHEIVATYANSPIEVFARVIKDLLADTHPEGLLGHIVDRRLRSSLGFYVSFLRSFTKLIFPEILHAFEHFRRDDDWLIIEQARIQGYNRALSLADELVRLHKFGQEQSLESRKAKIIETLIEPLGFLTPMESDERDSES